LTLLGIAEKPAPMTAFARRMMQWMFVSRVEHRDRDARGNSSVGG
jgi:hypothetical protein